MVSDSVHFSSFVLISLHFIAKVIFYYYYLYIYFFTSQVTQQVFVAEEWVRNSRSETRLALDARGEVEAQLGALKEKQAKMAEQVKEALRERDSAEAGLKTTEK